MLLKKISSRFDSITFEDEDILKLIQQLNIFKIHGYGDISIRMIKVRVDTTAEPPLILLSNSNSPSSILGPISF